jgi:cytochrome c
MSLMGQKAKSWSVWISDVSAMDDHAPRWVIADGNRVRRCKLIVSLDEVAADWSPVATVKREAQPRRLAVLAGIMSILLSPTATSQESINRRADVEMGEQVFNSACRTCHTTREGDNRLGPHLHDIVGRKAGAIPNYGYSSAMKSAGFVWDEATLDRFIANPDEIVPGNGMRPYGGLASVDTRAKLLLFLRSLEKKQ